MIHSVSFKVSVFETYGCHFEPTEKYDLYFHMKRPALHIRAADYHVPVTDCRSTTYILSSIYKNVNDNKLDEDEEQLPLRQ